MAIATSIDLSNEQTRIRSKLGFEPQRHTSAPLRTVTTIPVAGSVEAALEVMFDFDRLVSYLAGMRRVETEYDAQGKPTVRHCTVTGLGRFAEEIVWYDEAHGYAYSAIPAPGLPVKDQLGVMTVQADADASVIRWEQYFNWTGLLKPLVMKFMLPNMFKSVGKGLQRDLGVAGKIEFRWAEFE
ncbi:MAG: SRPBCC family protein [Planctomycetota bacterium]